MFMVLAVLVAGNLSAQPTPDDRILAQALFDDARVLMADQHYSEACVKFAESNRLDPGIGTQFNLADCYEMTGQLSGAWILFVDVAAAARAARQPDRSAVAQRRALALEPRLTRIRIDVQAPAEGLVVRRNGEPVPEPQWGTAVPVVPGRYRIEAHALGHYSWRKMVEARGKGVTVSVVIPELATDQKPMGEGDDTGPMPVRHLAAAIMGGCGLVGVGVGLGAGLVAIDKTAQAEDHCPEPDACYDAGIALRDEARDVAAVSTLGFVVGGGALVGALVLWLTAADDNGSQDQPATDDAAWWLLPAVGRLGELGAPTTVGLSVGGRW